MIFSNLSLCLLNLLRNLFNFVIYIYIYTYIFFNEDSQTHYFQIIFQKLLIMHRPISMPRRTVAYTNPIFGWENSGSISIAKK